MSGEQIEQTSVYLCSRPGHSEVSMPVVADRLVREAGARSPLEKARDTNTFSACMQILVETGEIAANHQEHKWPCAIQKLLSGSLRNRYVFMFAQTAAAVVAVFTERATALRQSPPRSSP